MREADEKDHATVGDQSATRAPRVFISYSHDSKEHMDRVLNFAQDLRRHGVDAMIDRFVLSPPEGWPRWMQKELETADFVIAICTENYRRRFEGREEPDRGLGVNWEGMLLKQTLYQSAGINGRIVPVLLDDAGDESVPMILAPYTRYRYPANAQSLLRMIYNKPEIQPAPIGLQPHLPAAVSNIQEDASRPFKSQIAERPATRVLVQQVFITRGVPRHTLVQTQAFSRLAGELLKPRLGLVVEGPSGIGKTVAVKQALADPRVAQGQRWPAEWIQARAGNAQSRIRHLLDTPVSQVHGHFIIDDFHRLSDPDKRDIADYIKVLADEDAIDAKITIIGIPRTRQSIVSEVPEIAHGALAVALPKASHEELTKLIRNGEVTLNVTFSRTDELASLAQGSFAIAQYLCEQALDIAGIRETQEVLQQVRVGREQLTARALELLRPQFHSALQAFAMQDRDADVRGAALTLLQSLGQSEGGAIGISDIRARYQEFEHAFAVFATCVARNLPDLDWPARWRDILYCNLSTGILALDDPKLHFYLKHLDWPTFWEDCGVFLSATIPTEAKAASPYSERHNVIVPDRGIPESRPNSGGIRAPKESQGIRLIHLSDLHFRDIHGWDMNPVLRRLADDVERIRSRRGHVDLAVLTGDVAYSGTANEYERARTWIIDVLLPASGLTPADLFIVPGNHDFDRRRYRGVTKLSHDSLIHGGSQSDVAAALEGDSNSPVLAGHFEFVKFLNSIGASGVKWSYPWAGVPRDIAGLRVHVACLSSSWLASGNNDRGRLALGLWQVNQVLKGYEDADIVIAAMHHPWDWMADWDKISRFELLRTSHIVLRGHLHDSEAIHFNSVGRDEVIELAAGASYEGSDIPLSYQFVEIHPTDNIVRVLPRYWSPHSRDWTADLNRFNGEFAQLRLPKKLG